MAEKIQGTVKWFSNKKGYGFITPKEGSVITEDIFVHQSAVHSDGYRTLDEKWEVEFVIGHDDDGKPKAENVTALGGGPCTGPRKPRANQNRHRRRRNASKKENGNEGDAAAEGSAPVAKREPQPLWHHDLSDEVKQALKDKQIRTSTGTIDVSFGNARIKLGTRGYASLANQDMILAEGSFECDADGHATFEWKRALRFTDVWSVFLDLSSIVSEVNLADESVKAVAVGETLQTLMGEGVTDPLSTLKASGFEMRRVLLTTKRR